MSAKVGGPGGGQNPCPLRICKFFDFFNLMKKVTYMSGGQMAIADMSAMNGSLFLDVAPNRLNINLIVGKLLKI